MSSVLSVSSASSSYDAWSAYRVGSQTSSIRSAQETKPDVNVGHNVATAHSTASSTQQGLPEGLLMSVNAPTSSNSQATADYRDLRAALQSGDLTAAQQAYTRMQIDLELTYSAQGSSQSSSASSAASTGSSGTGFNAVA
jgi:hypothetical protein